MNGILFIVLVLCCSFADADVHDAFPVTGSAVHEGVATCASSMCHGSVKPFERSGIRHNEYITWDRKDAHSDVYQALFTDEYRAITSKLGLKAPHKEPLCLNCHASNVPEKLRGKKFQLSDGIGCESCHGGSEKWLSSHTDKDASHKDNLVHGLYPLDDIVKRARLCMSCHYGNEHQFVTHEIMGAGHPRISFELDTFIELQPMHFDQDADYSKRKTTYDNIKVWAVGQAVATESVLNMLHSEKMYSAGLFPELSMFDCHSCHQAMSDHSWQPRRATELGPGVVRLNDANLIMLRHVITQVDATLGWQFRKMIRQLHASSNTSHQAFNQQVDLMRQVMPEILHKIVAHDFTAGDIRGILKNLVNEGIWDQYQDYVTAEQGVMAISALTISWDKLQPFNKKQKQAVGKITAQLYEIVADDEKYDKARLASSLKKLKTQLDLN